MNYRMQQSGWEGSGGGGPTLERVQSPTGVWGHYEPVLDDRGNQVWYDLQGRVVPAGTKNARPATRFAPDPTGFDPNRAASWSSQNPRLFYQIRDLLLESSELELGADAATRALNAYGERFQARNGRTPTWTDVRSDPEALVEMQRSALRTDMLPTVFTVATPQGTVVYENTSAKGPLPVPIAMQSDMRRMLLEQTSAEASGGGSPIAMQAYQAFNNLPVFTSDELEGLIDLTALTPKQPSGGGRASLRFDPDQLAEFFRERWRRRLREEPAQLTGLVNEFITAANQTFSAGGAAADADTWISQRMRREPRYSLLYGNMDPSQSEDEYLEGYLQPVSQFGLRASDANEQVIRGLSSGAAPASFAQSLQTTPEVVGLGQGPFSRRFAQMISRLGPLQRA